MPIMGRDYRCSLSVEPRAKLMITTACRTGRGVKLCAAPTGAVTGRSIERTMTESRSDQVSSLEFSRFAPLFAVFFAIAALPVLFCDTLPLFDYPNHLARMHILAALPDSQALQRFYAVVWRPVPNLAMDLIVPPLSRFLPLAWAGKAFVLATLFLLAGGAAALHRALFGGWSAWPLLAFLLLYSRTLLWGFLNYLFGLGLCLFALTLWIALARQRPALRLAVGMLLALGLFFAHLLAFGLYGVLVVGYELGEILRRRPPLRQGVARLAVAGASFGPAFAILVWLTPGAASGAIVYARFARKLDLLFSVFDTYSRPFDVACFVLVALALGLAFWRRWLRLAPAIAAPLALLFLVYLALPSQLATASGADHRVPLLLGLVLIAGSRWQAPRPAVERLFLGAALAVFIARIGVVTLSWQASDHDYAGLLPVLDEIPVGARVAVAFPPEALNSQPTPLAHFPTLAILRRDAFVPTLFAFPTQQPVALRPSYRALADRLPPERLWSALVTGHSPLDSGERDALADFDVVAILGRTAFTLPPIAGLAPIAVTPRFALLRVESAEPCSSC
jgi:hypothetical protein